MGVIKATHNEQKQQMCSFRQCIFAMSTASIDRLKSVEKSDEAPAKKNHKNNQELEAVVYNMQSYIKLKSSVHILDKTEGENIFPKTSLRHSTRTIIVNSLRFMANIHTKGKQTIFINKRIIIGIKQ